METTIVRNPASLKSRILVVDDHLDSAEMICNLLDRLGYESSSSFTLADAKARCESDEFDLLILDRDLPDGDGGELLRLYDTKAIALTGHAYPCDVVASRDAGFVDHLNKPIMFDELLRSVRKALGIERASSVGVVNGRDIEIARYAAEAILRRLRLPRLPQKDRTMPRPAGKRTKTPRPRAEPAAAAVTTPPLNAAVPAAESIDGRSRPNAHIGGVRGPHESFEHSRLAALHRGANATMAVRRKPILALLLAVLGGFLVGLMMTKPRRS